MKRQVNKSMLFLLSFVIVTIVGTLTHELGHLIPAKILGYETQLHYSSMNWESKYLQFSNVLYRKYKDKNLVPEFELTKLKNLKEKYQKDKFIITLGGPIQSMVTGSIGMLILYKRRKTLFLENFGFINWLAVFLSLFWSRQIFNLASGVMKKILNYEKGMFGGDEAKISELLNLPIGTFGLLTGLLGLFISIFLVFKVIPSEDQTLFLLCGLLGSGIGYLFWFYWAGPILLP